MSYDKHQHNFDRLLLVEKNKYNSGFDEHLTIYKQCACGEVLKEVKTPRNIVHIRAQEVRDRL